MQQQQTTKDLIEQLANAFKVLGQEFPLPFCTNCSQIVLRLKKMQDEFEALQQSIAEAVLDIKVQIQETTTAAEEKASEVDHQTETDSGSSSKVKTAATEFYAQTISTFRKLAIQGTIELSK